MSRVKDLPCNRCGELMWSGTTSLPEGKARCHACRRIEPQRGTKAGTVKPTLTMCPWCWQMFMPHNHQRQICCSRICAWAMVGEQSRVRAPNDQHQQRCEREKNAPGLSRSQRTNLLHQWQRQGKACAYCDEALVTTVDHVVPLIRGGTNYEGNLAPCCRPCNSSKAGHMVIEWRIGKRLPRMGRALAWQNRIRPVKVVKIKPPKPTHPCLVCDEPTRTLYCAPRCASEANNRRTRDRYRASVGLLVDFDRPTKAWLAA